VVLADEYRRTRSGQSTFLTAFDSEEGERACARAIELEPESYHQWHALCEFDDAVEEASAQATVPRADQAHIQSDLGNRARICNMLSTWPMPVLPLVIPN
jgi:hypothetical protein